jgi:hypothetical protein
MRWRSGRCNRQTFRASARQGNRKRQPRRRPTVRPLGRRGGRASAREQQDAGESRSERLDGHGITQDASADGRIQQWSSHPRGVPAVLIPGVDFGRPARRSSRESGGAKGRTATRASALNAAPPGPPADATFRQRCTQASCLRAPAGAAPPRIAMGGQASRQSSDGNQTACWKRAAGSSRFRVERLVSVVWKVSG